MPRKNPEDNKAYFKKHYAENKERYSYNRRAANLKQYGLTPDSFDTLLKSQGDVCAICEGPATGMWKSYHIDHDHRCCPGKNSCGKCIRGLLCYNCNVAIGLLKDSSEIIEKALTYTLNGGRYD